MIKFGVLCRLSNSLRSECLKHIEKDWIQLSLKSGYDLTTPESVSWELRWKASMKRKNAGDRGT